MTYVMKVATDPAAHPTANGSVVDYGQLSVAPWFGLPMSDPESYPQNSCTPDSDTDSGSPTDAAAAGSAFMELQFYPPGYTPFVDSESCSPTKRCAAMTIDSLECTYGFATCNTSCEELVNVPSTTKAASRQPPKRGHIEHVRGEVGCWERGRCHIDYVRAVGGEPLERGRCWHRPRSRVRRGGEVRP